MTHLLAVDVPLEKTYVNFQLDTPFFFIFSSKVTHCIIEVSAVSSYQVILFLVSTYLLNIIYC